MALASVESRSKSWLVVRRRAESTRYLRARNRSARVGRAHPSRSRLPARVELLRAAPEPPAPHMTHPLLAPTTGGDSGAGRSKAPGHIQHTALPQVVRRRYRSRTRKLPFAGRCKPCDAQCRCRCCRLPRAGAAPRSSCPACRFGAVIHFSAARLSSVHRHHRRRLPWPTKA